MPSERHDFPGLKIVGPIGVSDGHTKLILDASQCFVRDQIKTVPANSSGGSVKDMARFFLHQFAGKLRQKRVEGKEFRSCRSSGVTEWEPSCAHLLAQEALPRGEPCFPPDLLQLL